MDSLAATGTVPIIAAAYLVIRAAISDIRQRKISNKLNIGLTLCGALYCLLVWLSGHSFSHAILYPLLTSVGLFAFGLVLFALGMMGGGDVKMIAALGLFIGPKLVLSFLFITAIAGGFVALVTLIHVKVRSRPNETETEVAPQTSSVPYGVAIAVASIWIFVRILLTSLA